MAHESGSSVLILRLACLNLTRQENNSLALFRFPSLRSPLKEANIMTVVLTSKSKLEGNEVRNEIIRGRRVQCEHFMSLRTTVKLYY